jgi:hypothetical protein
MEDQMEFDFIEQLNFPFWGAEGEDSCSEI